MEPAKHFVIAMRDHDRSQNEPHLEQREGLQPIEKIHANLQSSSQFSVLSSQFSVLSSQFSVLSSQFSVISYQLSVIRKG
jgi:hypothetical protein